jgi:hypothetical protein
MIDATALHAARRQARGEYRLRHAPSRTYDDPELVAQEYETLPEVPTDPTWREIADCMRNRQYVPRHNGAKTLGSEV